VDPRCAYSGSIVKNAVTLPPNERQAAAADVALVYADAHEPGIRRRRAGSGFYYLWADGARVREPEVLERIRNLVIPPAWSEVWIAPSADSHLQVTGHDVRGRKQYRYHERWTACRDEVKYANLVEFARALPRLRRTIDADLGRRGIDRTKVLATVTRLLDITMIRVGNAAYARENGSFGLTTLRDRHVRIEGSTLRFRFKGKSGKEWRLKVTDRRIARIVKQAQDLPGQQLFQYLDEAGDRRGVSSTDVNAYIREAAGGPFSSKHFRTWGGTVLALMRFSMLEPPDSKRRLALATNQVIDEVSRTLGNTRTVCRKCYIHPRVLARWEEGLVAEDVTALRRRYRRSPAGLERAEFLTLRWLETQPQAEGTTGPRED
jgi:DNA topoisomerase-1